MLHILIAAGAVAAAGLVAGVTKQAQNAAIPVCKPHDPLVFLSTKTRRVYPAESATYKKNWDLAQAGKPTPSGRFVCTSEAKKSGILQATGSVPPHQK